MTANNPRDVIMCMSVWNVHTHGIYFTFASGEKVTGQIFGLLFLSSVEQLGNNLRLPIGLSGGARQASPPRAKLHTVPQCLTQLFL